MTTAKRRLAEIGRRGAAGEVVVITSIWSAHPVVIEAALRHGQRRSADVLIEAMCNQVNQDGGYTGMTPAVFRVFVAEVASGARTTASQRAPFRRSLAISLSTASISFSTTTRSPWTPDNLRRAASRQGRIAHRLVDWFSGIRLGQFDRNERRSKEREFLVDAKSRQSRNGENVVKRRHQIAAASTRSSFTREGQRRIAI
jgi:hypothetical protein